MFLQPQNNSHFQNQFLINQNFLVPCYDLLLVGTCSKSNFFLLLQATLCHKNMAPFTIDPDQYTVAQTALKAQSRGCGRLSIDLLTGNLNYTCKVLTGDNQFKQTKKQEFNIVEQQLEFIIKYQIEKMLDLLGYAHKKLSDTQNSLKIFSKFNQLCTPFRQCLKDLPPPPAPVQIEEPAIFQVFELQNEQNSMDIQQQDVSNLSTSPSQQYTPTVSKSPQKFERIGGYFKVTTNKFRIRLNNQDQQRQSVLVVKSQRQPEQSSTIDRLQHQIDILKKLKNTYYVSRYLVLQNSPYQQQRFTCMEFQTKYTLVDFLQNSQIKSLQLKLDLMIEIIKAVTSLHQSNIIHRDLKPANILIIESKRAPLKIKIIDFSESYHPQIQSKCRGYTMPYAPLQSIRKETPLQHTTKATDTWALGVIMYQLFQATLPIKYMKYMHNQTIKNWEKGFVPTLKKYPCQGLYVVHKRIIQLCELMLRSQAGLRIQLSVVASLLLRLSQNLKYYCE